jgi:two-component system chemotaxis response regulator CheY
MNRIYILCIEDQSEVLRAIVEDLSDFESDFIIEECESVDEAHEVLDDIERAGDFLALVISDHVMPGTTGVDFLVSLHKDPRFAGTRKILLTGLATHQDTIKAINQANIDHYIEKPWSKEMLTAYVKELLTRFIVEKGLDYRRYLTYLDQSTLYGLLRDKGEF